MGKKYVMFVDERGFLSKDHNNNFSMIGIIVECDYCNDLKRKIDRYKGQLLNGNNYNVFLDDIMLKKSVLEEFDDNKAKELINELPFLLKNLKFTIISSVIKQGIYSQNDSYFLAAKNLLKSFYSFIMIKNGICGGIIMEARQSDISQMMQQSFFNLYNERNENLSMLEGIHKKINSFIVCEKCNETYGAGIELSNMLVNVISRFSNGLKSNENKLIPIFEFGNRDKIFKEIKRKSYSDTYMDLTNKKLEQSFYDKAEISEKELRKLKEQLKIRDTRLNEKESEIKELTSEIQVLNQQLEEALLSRKSDNLIFQILSDIDFKMKGIENSPKIAKY